MIETFPADKEIRVDCHETVFAVFLFESQIANARLMVAAAAVAVGLLVDSASAQLVAFQATPPLAKQDHIVRELEKLHETLQSELKVPEFTKTLRVYVFRNGNDYRKQVRQFAGAALSFPRGLYVERAGQPVVMTYHQPDLRTLLRNRLTHAVLDAAYDRLPLWLDKGLCEYYAVKDGEQPAYRRLLRRQSRTLWRPSTARMASWKNAALLGAVEHAEAWSWVALLMKKTPDGNEMIADYLKTLEDGEFTRDFGAHLPRLIVNPQAQWEQEFRPSR